MVFYYSATGNSQWIAQSLARQQGEKLISITDELKTGATLRYHVSANEPVGFVFPVHAWKPPETVLDFIRQVQIDTVGYLYAVATCGDSSGYTMRVMDKACEKRQWKLNAKWEVQMPNNYLPLQDVDSSQREKEKLDAAAEMVQQIHRSVVNQSPGNLRMEGKHPRFKTSFIGYFFCRFGKSSRPFYITDACTGCGLCQQICLKNTITLQDGQPHWGKVCDQCYACINRCPQKAIQYGRITETRGRYCHPSLKI